MADTPTIDQIRRLGRPQNLWEMQQELQSMQVPQQIRQNYAAPQQPPALPPQPGLLQFLAQKLMPSAQAQGYGNRLDNTPKGQGYFGPLKRPDGDVSTELSFDFEHPKHGKVFAPLLVPGLSRQEIDHLLADQKPTDAIYNKAQDFALERLRQGKPTFALPNEQFPVPDGK